MQEPATAPMGEVLTKIHVLSRHEASFDAGHHTVRFMRYATAQTSNYFRETDTVFPETFLMAIVMALNDAMDGKNTMGGEPPNRMLSGFPVQLYALVQRDIPKVVDILFEPTFAAEAKEAWNDLKAMLAAPQRRAG